MPGGVSVIWADDGQGTARERGGGRGKPKREQRTRGGQSGRRRTELCERTNEGREKKGGRGSKVKGTERTREGAKRETAPPPGGPRSKATAQEADAAPPGKTPPHPA